MSWQINLLYLAETLYDSNKKVMQNLKKNRFVVPKMTRIWWILIWALKSLNNLHFDWSLLCKVYNVWPKKYRGAIFHDTEVSCTIWRKTGLWFWKWYEEFGKFSLLVKMEVSELEMSKLGLWWDPFVQNRKYMNQITKEFCVMALKNDEKFEEKLTCCFKIDIRDLTNFDWSTQKSQKF